METYDPALDDGVNVSRRTATYDHRLFQFCGKHQFWLFMTFITNYFSSIFGRNLLGALRERTNVRCMYRICHLSPVHAVDHV